MDRAMTDFQAVGIPVNAIVGSDGADSHLQARAPCGRDGPPALVLCHIVSVHPGGTLARNGVRTDGDCTYRPIIYEMKGGGFLALTVIVTSAEAVFRPVCHYGF